MAKALKPQRDQTGQLGDEVPILAIILVIGVAVVVLMFWSL